MNSGYSKEAEEDYRDDLRADDAHKRRYRNKLTAYPDCRDPAHPGCDKCEEDEE